MKILKSLSNFIWLFIVIGVLAYFAIFPSKSSSSEDRFPYNNILDITLGDILGYALSILAAIFLVWFYIRLRVWWERKKHPEMANFKSTYVDEEDAMNAFLNPHDPILNPQPKKK